MSDNPLTYFTPQGVTREQHEHYGCDWQGQELFYIIDKNQNGAKKVVGGRFYLLQADAAHYCVQQDSWFQETHEVRSIVLPYQGDMTDESIADTIAALQENPTPDMRRALEVIAHLQTKLRDRP